MPIDLKHIDLFFFDIPNYESKKYLLAVSGGVDSMVLLDFFKQAGLNFSVAHCNFKLREKQADLDEQFVIVTCEEANIHFFTTSFDTKEYKKQQNISTQMAARELRYNWFQELMGDFDYLVTAHHLDDNIETIFLNLTRGTGIEGLTGMKSLNDNLFRPLLSFTKEQIYEYAQLQGVKYREDASNFDDSYKRNKLRNQVIPLMLELNPGFRETMKMNIANFKAEEKIVTKSIEKGLSDFMISTSGSDFFIDLEKLKKADHSRQYLFHFLKPFGYNYSVVSQLMDSVLSDASSTGKYFNSISHRTLIDRNKLILSPILELDQQEGFVNKKDKTVTYPVKLTLNSLPKEQVQIKKQPNYAYFDEELIQYPLKIRKWEKGDFFKPFGMVGKKKISDYLIDNKVSRNRKEQIFVLESKGKIIWLIGHRSNEDFKISDSTNSVLIVKTE